MILRRLFPDPRGASVVEFALLAPVFVTALFGIIEGSRWLWTSQALNEAAYSTVRCKSIGASACNSESKQIDYAVARARGNGIAVSAANVTVQSNIACRGQSGSAQVTIRTAFNSPVTRLLPFPSAIEATACFPTL